MMNLLTRLRAAGSTGADMSPGDPLCAEAAAALEGIIGVCTWGEDCGTWSTSCNQYFMNGEDCDPANEWMKFCPFCGKTTAFVKEDDGE